MYIRIFIFLDMCHVTHLQMGRPEETAEELETSYWSDAVVQGMQGL